jgi:hypothetical protein
MVVDEEQAVGIDVFRMQHKFFNRTKHCDFYNITSFSCNKDFEDEINLSIGEGGNVKG